MANTWTNFYPTLFSDKAYMVFSRTAIAPQVVNTTWIAPGGPCDAVRIPKFGIGTSAIKNVADLVDTPDNASESSLLLSLDQNRGFHYQVRYNEQEKANVALGQALLTQRVAALAADVDDKVFAKASGATTTLSGSITKAMLVSGIELLNEANAPQTDRVLVVNPDGYSDILNINDFVRADSIAGADANRTGRVGMVLGLEVYLSNNLTTVAVDGLLMHRAAIGMAMLTRIETKIFDQPRHFSVGYTGRAIWGATLVDAGLVVNIDRA